MATVRQLMNTKTDYKNYTVEYDDNVLNALEIMGEADISAVMVTQKDKIVGIFTERDYSRKCELKGLSAKDTPVHNLMTEKMFTVNPDTSMDECMGLMNQHHIRHLPVVENDKLVGMVSMRDVVDILISDHKSTIKGLENYILGSGFST
jgi:CBS domain-containing protein